MIHIWWSLGPVHRVSYRGGDGGGGFIPLMILARGGYPPHQTAEQCFFNGHFSEVLQESVQKTNPLFFSKFVFSNCPPPPPHKFVSGGNPGAVVTAL